MPKTNAFGDPIIEGSQSASRMDAFGDPIVDQPKRATLSGALGVKDPDVANFVDAPQNFLEGVGSGVMSTARGVSKLAHRAIPAIPEIPEGYAKPPEGFMGAVGHYGEQAAEFLAPVGLIGKAGKAIDGATAAVRGGRVLAGAGKAALEGLSTGAITTAQTGSPTEGAKAGATGAAVSGVLQTLPKTYQAVKNRLTPERQRAVDWFKREGGQTTVGQQTGNQQVTRLEGGLENTFGSSGRATGFYKGQQSKLQELGQETIDNAVRPAASKMNPYEAGSTFKNKIRSIVSNTRAQADQMYDDLRAAYQKNTQQVQVGTKQSAILDPYGNPVTTPVMKAVELPVDVGRSKATLAPVLEELEAAMPEAQKQHSPGLAALRQIVRGPDVVDAATADRNLSAIKYIARSGNNPYLSTQSQGLAKKTIGALEGDVSTAFNNADPALLPKLKQARDTVRFQHEVAEKLNDLPEEPAALYNHLVTAGDKTYDELKALNQLAPQELRQVGHTFLQGLLDKATSEGGFRRAPGIMASWEKLGPKTKELLFGQQGSIDELDRFFLAAKHLTGETNPSHTAHALSALGVLGASLDAAKVMYDTGSPVEAGKRAGRNLMVLGGTSNIMAKILMTPRGAGTLTAALTTPAGSPAQRLAIDGALSLIGRKKDEIPQYAKGGIIRKPTIAMVGENAPRDPEVIIPMSKMTPHIARAVLSKLPPTLESPARQSRHLINQELAELDEPTLGAFRHKSRLGKRPTKRGKFQ